MSAAKRRRLAPILEEQLQALQDELEYERKLRRIDQKQAEREKLRLEKLVAAAVAETEEEKALAQELREEIADQQERLERSRESVLRHVQELERWDETPPDVNIKAENHRLQTELDALEEQHDELLQHMEQLRAEKLSLLDRPPVAREPEQQPIVSEARPEILQELTRLRNKMADMERIQRQSERSYSALETKYKQAIRESTGLRMAESRVSTLEEDLSSTRRELELLKAQEKTWKDLQKELDASLVAPSASSVVIKLREAQTKARDALAQVQEKQSEIQELQNASSVLRGQLETAQQEAQRVISLEESNLVLQAEKTTSAARVDILKREIQSLHRLIQTYDVNLSNPAESGTLHIDGAKAASYETAQEEMNRLEKEVEHWKSRYEKAAQKQDEIDRITAKYAKLRNALEASRVTAAQATARANQAEQLAGKGSFDPNHTRVLHIEETPLITALRTQVRALQARLDNSDNSSIVHDPDKLNQRLKESFKEQIALFREGVYMMTGLKVEMNPSGDRPTFRVRSLFSDNEDDQLLLQWPKKKDGNQLDILRTDWAKALSQTASYQYLTKGKSMPAFLASVQLELFEKQTVMM